MSDVEHMEREKLKLKDLLDMGFIHEEEYRQRFADLTGLAPPAASAAEGLSSLSSSYDYYGSPLSSSTTKAEPDMYSASAASSWSSPSHYASPSTGGSSSSSTGGVRPFQPVEPCDCGVSYCRCGLQIPQCLVEDHAQVCSQPAWDAFKCPLRCGSVFGSSGEASAHLKFCSLYTLACKCAGNLNCAVFFGIYPSWCGADVLACDMPQHWGQVHKPHVDLGDLQLPLLLDCPVCNEHLGERWNMHKHFSEECEGYTVACGNLVANEGVCQDQALRRKDVARHWEEVHRSDPDYGPDQVPMKRMGCPNRGCMEEVNRDQLSNHLAHCHSYEPMCHWCRKDMASMDELKAHMAAGCQPLKDQPWHAPPFAAEC